jgi:hypothetical protein
MHTYYHAELGSWKGEMVVQTFGRPGVGLGGARRGGLHKYINHESRTGKIKRKKVQEKDQAAT